MKTGLVLEGGAMRGLFTAGVIDVMMENGISFDGIIGVSAGAAFGCNYKSRQIGRALRYNTAYCNDPRYCGFRSLIKTGDIYGVQFCYHEIPDKLDPFDYDTFKNDETEFHVVCTDVMTGKAVYRRIGDARGEGMELIRASASMPLVSRIVETDGMKLLDGGIADSVPLRYFESIGYDRNIIVLTRPMDYEKKESKMLPLIKLRMKKYPALCEAMAKRHRVYNETLEYIKKREESGEILVLRPESDLGIGHIEHDPKELKRVYKLGRALAEKRLGEIKSFSRTVC